MSLKFHCLLTYSQGHLTFTWTVCSLSWRWRFLGIGSLLTEGRLPPNLSLICCRDRAIFGELRLVGIIVTNNAHCVYPSRCSKSPGSDQRVHSAFISLKPFIIRLQNVCIEFLHHESLLVLSRHEHRMWGENIGDRDQGRRPSSEK